MKPRLLLTTDRATEAQLRVLSAHAEVHQLGQLGEKVDDIIARIDCMLVHGWPPELDGARISRMSRLRFIQSVLAGVNHIPFRLLDDMVLVCSNAGAYSDGVAEYAWGLILAAAKGIVRYDSSLRSGTWVPKSPPDLGKEIMALRGKALGIIGYGGIGRSVSRIGRAFGVHTYAYARRKKSERGIQFFYGGKGLANLLSKSDIVVLSLPHTKLTAGIIGGRELARMKKNSILVNVGRAEAVSQAALYEHLSKTDEFTYATDVWWLNEGKESYAPEYPLLSLLNFIGTPHASGPAASATGVPMELAVQNTVRFLKGLKPKNIVDRSDYL